MAEPEQFRVKVVYASPSRQAIVDIGVSAEMSIAQAVERSGLVRRFPEIAEKPLACAIYGQSAALTRKVRAGDRIEILRPLLIDPKEKRRQAATRERAKVSNRSG